VTSGEDKVKLTMSPDKKEDRALLVIDGQDNQELKANDTVEVNRSNVRLKLIRSSKRSYFTILREKFKLSV
jgi:NAD kinase